LRALRKAQGGVQDIVKRRERFVHGGCGCGCGCGKYQPAGVVHKGEYVFDADATRRIGVKNLERLRQGFAEGGFVGSAPRLPNLRGGGGSTINAPVSVSIDARGADRDGLSRVEEQVARLKAELPSKIVSTVRDARSRRAI
jgi:phage-related minor tail protein